MSIAFCDRCNQLPADKGRSLRLFAMADQMADQAAPGSRESMFTIEAALFRHLQRKLALPGPPPGL
jgi:hypothetical protein